MLRVIPQKEGTFLQVLEPVLTHSQHEEEEVFIKQQPLLPFGGNFTKSLESRNAIDAIFWGCLAIGRDIDDLSGTTIRYMLDVSAERSPEYLAGLIIKYIREARHPLAFLQTVFNKEPDPLAQAEINAGKETINAGAELLRNINRLDELGLNKMRDFTRPFAALDFGKTLESAKAALESLQEKRAAFLENWGEL